MSACSQAPVDCEKAYDYRHAREYTIREQFLTLTPTYDIMDENGCDIGTMSRRFFSFLRETDIEGNNVNLGRIETELLSFGYDMNVYDSDGNIINTADHKLMDSMLNFGGFYIEIKNTEGKIVGTMKQDPFSLFTGGAWKYFDIKDTEGNIIAEIEYTSFIPDTYKVTNNSDIDNRTIAGIVGLLDQIEDEMNDSDDSSSDD